MTADLLASKQPHVSFYYSAAMMLPGNLVFRDLKTITALGAASVGQAKLQMLGKSGEEIVNLELATGVPIVYQLNADSTVKSKAVLD